MKVRIALIAAMALAVTGSALAQSAAAPTITGGIVGSGQVTYKSLAVSFSPERGYLMEWAKVPPGATFGWHFHRVPIMVVITAGTLTLYDSKDSSCAAKRYTKGQGFIEPADHVHMARNESSTAVSLYATYLGVSASQIKNPTPLDASAKNPGNCPRSIR